MFFIKSNLINGIGIICDIYCNFCCYGFRLGFGVRVVFVIVLFVLVVKFFVKERNDFLCFCCIL